MDIPLSVSFEIILKYFNITKHFLTLDNSILSKDQYLLRSMNSIILNFILKFKLFKKTNLIMVYS